MTHRIHAVMEIGPEINFYKSPYSLPDTASQAKGGKVSVNSYWTRFGTPELNEISHINI